MVVLVTIFVGKVLKHIVLNDLLDLEVVARGELVGDLLDRLVLGLRDEEVDEDEEEDEETEEHKERVVLGLALEGGKNKL